MRRSPHKINSTQSKTWMKDEHLNTVVDLKYFPFCPLQLVGVGIDLVLKGDGVDRLAAQTGRDDDRFLEDVKEVSQNNQFSQTDVDGEL